MTRKVLDAIILLLLFVVVMFMVYFAGISCAFLFDGFSWKLLVVFLTMAILPFIAIFALDLFGE